MMEKKGRIQEPRRASTVVLIRQSPGPFQVYLIRRSSKSAFMPGNYVFPGGNLDSDDWDIGFWGAHLDLDQEEVAQTLGGDLSDAETVAHGVAAIRETFEEAGVLLASQPESAPQTLAKISQQRMTQDLSQTWFREWVESEKWNLAFSSLGRWSHWITPKARSLRYDARFFLAFMPADQECVPDSLETTHGIWVSPEKGLLGNLRGELPLSPPALVTLHELLHYRQVKDLKKEMEDHPWGQPRLPIFRSSSAGLLIVLPWDPQYDDGATINPAGLAKKRLAVGEPFSRLWFEDGVWRPVQTLPGT
jgi:8-oxo-dGTP pyrophosphatase MutT (NUDIX family)